MILAKFLCFLPSKCNSLPSVLNPSHSPSRAHSLSDLTPSKLKTQNSKLKLKLKTHTQPHHPLPLNKSLYFGK